MNGGRVHSTKLYLMDLSSEQAARFWSLVDSGEPDECWHWEGGLLKSRGNYGQVGFNYKKYRSHRVAYELAKGPLSSEDKVLHTCDNPKCCNPSHLLKGTTKDNHDDMCRKRRQYKKLTPENVEELRNASFGQVGIIAKRLGVHFSTASRARRGLFHVL